MSPSPRGANRLHDERGLSLIELLVTLIILAVGILAVGQIFPSGARSQQQDRLLTGANYWAQDKVELLSRKRWSDADLSDGRHPAGTATESLENGQWQRFYTVNTMTGALINLKKITVTVNYRGAGITSRSISTTTYVRR